MPSDKRNLIMAIATTLISSLFNLTSSRDVPFRQPQQLQCSHHGSSKIIFVFLCTAKVAICGTCLMASVQDKGKCRAAGVLLTLVFAWNAVQHVQTIRSKTKQ